VRPAPLAMASAAAVSSAVCSITPVGRRGDALVLLGCGGRELAWPVAQVAWHLERLAAGRPVIRLLHGAARGADGAIGLAAEQLGWEVLPVPAQWRLHGRRAGMQRNRRMLQQAITIAQAASSPQRLVKVGVIAFPGGVGTAAMLQLARRAAAGGWVGAAVIRG